MTYVRDQHGAELLLCEWCDAAAYPADAVGWSLTDHRCPWCTSRWRWFHRAQHQAQTWRGKVLRRLDYR